MDTSVEKQELIGELTGTNESGQGNIIVSVVVCTYNRSTYLSSCLQSLAEQNTADRILFEVVVVDNNSLDNTQQVVTGFVNKYQHFRLLFEPVQGLSQARNRGWKEAYGQYVAYIDDDAIAYPDWISSILDFIKRYPDAGIFGGPYDAFSLVPKPDWFPPEYGSLNFGEHERCIEPSCEWITGSNMVIKKELFHRYGGFDVALGMSGSEVAYGEEVKFFLSMCDKGNRIVYVPSIRVKHLIAEYKLSLNWLLLSAYSSGRQYEIIFNVKRSLLFHLTDLMVALIRGVCAMLRPEKMPFKRRVFSLMYPLYYQIGTVVEHVSSYHCR